MEKQEFQAEEAAYLKALREEPIRPEWWRERSCKGDAVSLTGDDHSG